MRPLSLHVSESALSGREYGIFTTFFANIIGSYPALATDDDIEIETRTVPVHDAVMWLRGRYLDLSMTHCNEVSISLSPSGTSFLTIMP